jgi:hypothetical protein
MFCTYIVLHNLKFIYIVVHLHFSKQILYTYMQCKCKSIYMHNTSLDLLSKYKSTFCNHSIE